MCETSNKIPKENFAKTCDNNKDTLSDENSSNRVQKIKLDTEKSDQDKEGMKLPKLKPNFFLGFQVYDRGIHEKVKKLQEKVITQNPLLHSALVNVSTLHVTLAVTHLAGEPEIKILKEQLNNWANENIKSFFDEPVFLNFTGVKTFNNVVAFVDIDHCENYKKVSGLSSSLNNLLSSAGFSTDSRSFTPHLTILKLSKDFKLLKTKKKFKNDFELLKQCTDHFGKQKVSHIQLLSMDDVKDEFGYYKCFHQINVSDSIEKMDHSECCIPIPKPKMDS